MSKQASEGTLACSNVGHVGARKVASAVTRDNDSGELAGKLRAFPAADRGEIIAPARMRAPCSPNINSD
jgi:hypothetical protein